MSALFLKKNSAVHLSAAVLAGAGMLLAAGCGAGSQFLATNGTGPTLSGRVMGGRQPIGGSTLTVWQVGNTGYGSAATVLATTTSDSGGNFGTTGHSFGAYNCPTTTPSQLYITASSGNPGNSTSTNNPTGYNPDILLVAPLGACPGEQSAEVTINEVSTIATVFATSGFINPATFVNGTGSNIGTAVGTAYTQDAIGTTYSANPTFAANNNNVTGLNNAFTTISTLIYPTAGLGPGFTPGATVDYQKINTLANILANCVNSDPLNGGTICSTLFTNVSTAGLPAAANTFEAAYYMATNPTDNTGTTSNLATVFNAVPTTPPYAPALTTQPTDWTIGVNYAVTGLIGGQRIAIDGSGNAWVTGNGTVNGASSATGTPQVVQISPGGGVISYSGGQGAGATAATITSPFGVAADLNGNVLVTDSGTNTILQFTTTPSYIGPIAGTTATTPSGLEPYAIAFDTNNKAWITENTTSPYAVPGTPVSGILVGCGYTPGSPGTFCAGPLGVGTAGGEGTYGMALTKTSTILTTDRFQVAASPGTLTATTDAGAIRSWVGGGMGGGTSNNYAYYTNSKAYFPTGIGIDANNDLWFSNTDYIVSGGTNYGGAYTSSYLTRAVITSGTPGTSLDTLSAGSSATTVVYTGGGLNGAMFLSMDGKSNIWVANSAPNSSNYSVSEFTDAGTAVSPATTGFVHTMVAPNDVAVDASGNVWVVSNNAAYVTEIVGAASPTVVPTVLNTKYNTWGQKP